MPDISLYIGQDIATGSTGDLLPVDGSERGKQRILRRLLTNPGDYIWHLEYGAGLGQFIGQPTRGEQIKAVIQEQMSLEDAVLQTEPPAVTVSPLPDGSFFVSIQYTDALTSSPLQLQFNISA